MSLHRKVLACCLMTIVLTFISLSVSAETELPPLTKKDMGELFSRGDNQFPLYAYGRTYDCDFKWAFEAGLDLERCHGDGIRVVEWKCVKYRAFLTDLPD